MFLSLENLVGGWLTGPVEHVYAFLWRLGVMETVDAG